MTLKTFGGRDANITTRAARQLLEAQVLKGLVKHMKLGLVPDMISAPIMAKEAGVESVSYCHCSASKLRSYYAKAAIFSRAYSYFCRFRTTCYRCVCSRCTP